MKLSTKQRNQAVVDLTKKLNLEKTFARELSAFFLRMNKDFKTLYVGNGNILNFNDYTSDLSGILRAHYLRTQKAFRGRVLKANGVFFFKEQKQDEILELSLFEWIKRALLTQPQEIIKTTKADAQKSVVAAREAIAADGGELSIVNIGLVAAAINKRKLLGRIAGVAITETQAAAESTRLLEAETLMGKTPFTLEGDPFARTRPQEEPLKAGTKQWLTVSDSKVRQSHREADKQKRPINKPFDVGGSRMRHPGDRGLDAPIKEWINCRCSSVMEIEGF